MAFGGLFGGSSSSNNNNNNTNSDSSAPSELSLPLPPSPTSPTGSSDIKTRLQTAITTQSNLINAKYLIQKINENCFEHCVPEPGASLSSKEQTCLSTCMEKYIEAWNVVSKSYVGRLQKEGASLGINTGGKPEGGLF